VTLVLREVRNADLEIFFEHQNEPEAQHMAAFVRKDAADREAFFAHWKRIRTDESVIIRTIDRDGEVVGSVLSYETEGKPEVSYWIGQQFWGQGIATAALEQFLETCNPKRPMLARVAKDNVASLRVLEKCGFRKADEGMGFANARGADIAEWVLVCGAPAPTDSSN
jgi:RimJ/RimL family protein N-acetyltransferase